MRIIAQSTIREYCEAHGNVTEALLNWLEKAEAANWATPQAVREEDATASILANNRVCFNIRGNAFRLIVGIDYRRQIVFIKWFGTHAEYDRIDAETVEHL